MIDVGMFVAAAALSGVALSFTFSRAKEFYHRRPDRAVIIIPPWERAVLCVGLFNKLIVALAAFFIPLEFWVKYPIAFTLVGAGLLADCGITLFSVLLARTWHE